MFVYVVDVLIMMSCLVTFKVLMFNHELKRPPRDLKDFMTSYKLRLFSIIIFSAFSMFLIAVWHEEIADSASYNIKQLAFLTIFAVPWVYMAYLARQGKQ